MTSCSSTPELETGEIKTIQLLNKAFSQLNDLDVLADSRKLLTRAQIDAAGIPILFVELETGQNGTLTPYPGEGIGQTWLGADGATITLKQGVLKASRGMGDDLMGSISEMPEWLEINNNGASYRKKLEYLSGNNQIISLHMECDIKRHTDTESKEIWGKIFYVIKYEEACSAGNASIANVYYLDKKMIVRKSRQYHSQTLGYIMTERLDR